MTKNRIADIEKVANQIRYATYGESCEVVMNAIVTIAVEISMHVYGNDKESARKLITEIRRTANYKIENHPTMH